MLKEGGRWNCYLKSKYFLNQKIEIDCSLVFYIYKYMNMFKVAEGTS